MAVQYSKIIIIVALLGSMISGTYFIVDGLTETRHYNIETNTSVGDEFDHTRNVTNRMSESFDDITGKDNSTGFIANAGDFFSFTDDALSLAIDLISLPFNVLIGVTSDIVSFLSLPSWINGLLVAVVGTTVIFALIALITRFSRA